MNSSWLALFGGMPEIGLSVSTVFSENTPVAISPVATAPSGNLLHEDMFATVI
jgi:hypothetical protein